MKKSLLAIAAAVSASVIAAPAPAVTFPSLTTIYVGSGVLDDGAAGDAGIATSIQCSNVSGVAVQVRVLILGPAGAVEDSATRNPAHGATVTFSTHATRVFGEDAFLATGSVRQGVVNVEATNSAIFCTAVVVDAANLTPVFMSPLHLVRVNPHPGTVE